MGIFVNLKIDLKRCLGISRCGECLKVCPVKIFDNGDEHPVSIAENEDECTLCDLCLDVCEPDAIRICKLYQ